VLRFRPCSRFRVIAVNWRGGAEYKMSTRNLVFYRAPEANCDNWIGLRFVGPVLLVDFV